MYSEEKKDCKVKELKLKDEQNLSNSVREEYITLPIGRLIYKNALPAVLSMLFIAFYQVIDGVMVGRRLGPEALASVNILYPIVALLVGLAIMISVGGNARIAILLGEGETKKAGSTLSLILSIGCILGLIGSLIIIIAMPQIFKILGSSGQLGVFAGQYLRMLCPFFPCMTIQLILEQSVRNDGRPNLATVVMFTMAMLNIFLDYVFIYILNMGISGAALATGIAQSISAIIFTTYFIRKTVLKREGLVFGIPNIEVATINGIVRNGLSEFFNSIALGITTFLFNIVIISYVGPIGIAAFAIVQYILLFGMTILIGISTGTQPIISYNFGAKLIDRVYSALKRVLFASIIVGVTFFIIVRYQTEPLLRIFISNNIEALEITANVASKMSWAIMLMPIGIAGAAFFTAIEEAGKSLIVAICRGLLFTLVGLAIFPLLLKETGIWITPVFSEGLTALVTIVLIKKWISSYYLIIKPKSIIVED